MYAFNVFHLDGIYEHKVYLVCKSSGSGDFVVHCNQRAQVAWLRVPAFDVLALFMLAGRAVPTQPADVPASCKVSSNIPE